MPGISPHQESQIRQLVDRENMIEAIKLYREMTGVGLKETKDGVEAIIRGEPVDTSISVQSKVPSVEQIKQLLVKQQKIRAVKLYREVYNCDLKDAKYAVDAIEAKMRREIRTPTVSNDPLAEDKQRNRKFLSFVVAILLIGALVFFLLLNNGL